MPLRLNFDFLLKKKKIHALVDDAHTHVDTGSTNRDSGGERPRMRRHELGKIRVYEEAKRT